MTSNSLIYLKQRHSENDKSSPSEKVAASSMLFASAGNGSVRMEFPVVLRLLENIIELFN
jgi:hypothetical protein